jgi:hypothetical protein
MVLSSKRQSYFLLDSNQNIFLQKEIISMFLPLKSMPKKQLAYLPVGRRLHRDYWGGAKVPDDTRHMEFGLYLFSKSKWRATRRFV